MAEQNIRSLYSLAEKRRDAAETARDSGSSTYKENLAAAIASYEESRKLADRLSLFSPNETLEDIATGDLEWANIWYYEERRDPDITRYLLIDYHLGELVIKLSDTDRKSTLQNARAAYERYLNLLDQYGIFTSSEKKLYQSYTDHPTTFSTISTAGAEARRASKIANYNHEKELKQKLTV
jgi:immunoglobulin-binding protein 1